MLRESALGTTAIYHRNNAIKQSCHKNEVSAAWTEMSQKIQVNGSKFVFPTWLLQLINCGIVLMENVINETVVSNVRLVFHKHLNSHVAYPGIPPENQNHTRGQ